MNLFLENENAFEKARGFPIKRQNSNPIISNSPPKMSSETQTITTSETQPTSFKVVNKTPPHTELRVVNNEELEKAFDAEYT